MADLRRLAPAILVMVAAAISSATIAAPKAMAQTAPCEKRVQFGMVDVKTDGCLNRVADQRWESTDTVTLNGLPLPVTPGSELVLTGPTDAKPGGTLSVRTNITVRGVTLHDGLLATDLPTGPRGSERVMLSLSPPAGQKMFGFSVAGNVEVRLGIAPSFERYSKLKVVLALPDAFKNGPSRTAGGVTATVAIRADSNGVQTEAAKAELEHVYMGQLELKQFCISYVGSNSSAASPCSPPRFGGQQLLTCEGGSNVDRWDGSASIVLPTKSKPEVGLYAGAKNGAFSYAGAQVTGLGNSVPLAEGVYVDKFGLAICLNPPPLKLKGAAGIRFGPQFSGREAAYLDASIQYTDSNPWMIRADGNMSVFGRGVGGGYFIYKSTNAIDFGFNASFNFLSILSTSANVNGWIETRSPARFNVDGNGRICLASVACTSGEVTTSTVGAAGCFTLLSFTYYVLVKDSNWHWYAPWRVHFERRSVQLRAGGGYTWSSSRLDTMGNSCHLDSFRAVRGARAAQNGVTTVEIPEEPAVVLRLTGRTAAPEVELIGPDGRRIVSPEADAHIQKGSHAFVEDDRTKTSSVVIGKPAPGTWRIRVLPGSSDVVRVEQAETREPATIVGEVARHKKRHVLGYAYEAHEDHPVTFVERGRHTHKALGAAKGKPCRGEPNGPSDRQRPLCGRIRFNPAPGPGGKRRIYAIIHEDGHPFDEELVDTYRAPGDPRPRHTRRVSLVRKGRTVKVAWADARHADHWNVRVSLSDGRRLVHVHRGESEREIVRDVGRRTRVRVTVVGLRNHDHAEGRPMRARLRAGQRRSR